MCSSYYVPPLACRTAAAAVHAALSSAAPRACRGIACAGALLPLSAPRRVHHYSEYWWFNNNTALAALQTSCCWPSSLRLQRWHVPRRAGRAPPPTPYAALDSTRLAAPPRRAPRALAAATLLKPGIPRCQTTCSPWQFRGARGW